MNQYMGQQGEVVLPGVEEAGVKPAALKAQAWSACCARADTPLAPGTGNQAKHPMEQFSENIEEVIALAIVVLNNFFTLFYLLLS